MSTDDIRRKYLEELAISTEPHRARGFEYEKLALDYSAHVFRTISFLNGGALIALPTAVALFGFDAKAQKAVLVTAGCFFIGGLIFVCLAQMFAFFTMARRSESEGLNENSQRLIAGSRHYPNSVDLQETKQKVEENDAEIRMKISSSNRYRLFGILAAWISVAAFVTGCLFGVKAILSAPIFF